jgi:GntR family transcriptional regulator
MTTPVSRARGLPYYVQVSDSIRESLRGGRWRPGEMIPPEGKLCEMFGVSRTAVRHALEQLVGEGLLHKEMGRGTFVTQPQVSLGVQELRGLFDEMAAQGRSVQTTVLYAGRVVVPPQVAPRLGVPMRSEVMLVERVRHVAGEPLVHARTYLPLPRFAALADEDLTSVSLYAILHDRFGVRIGGGQRRVEAVTAAGTEAELLQVKPRSPLLYVTATNLDSDGAPFEYFEAWYRADRTSFEVVVSSSTASAQGLLNLGRAEGL